MGALSFYIVNGSTAFGDTVAFGLMVLACSHQVTNDFCDRWGRYATVQMAASIDDVPSVGLNGARVVVINVVDNSSEENALGWHTEQESGRLIGEIGVRTILDNGGSLIGDGQPHSVASLYSVSSVLSHEILETLADPNVNQWIQRPDGVLVALEVGDPVEGDSYTIDALGVPVLVSNFILPAWGDPDSKGPFDFLGQLSQPFAMSPGGYMVVMDGGEVSQVYGERHPEWRKASRRRGAIRRKVSRK